MTHQRHPTYSILRVFNRRPFPLVIVQIPWAVHAWCKDSLCALAEQQERMRGDGQRGMEHWRGPWSGLREEMELDDGCGLLPKCLVLQRACLS